MRIVISEFISLEGVIQAPGGPEEDTDGGFAHGGWSLPFFDPDVMGAAIGAGFASVEALLFGRRTFQGMAKAWPERAGDPFADQMNAIKKYVVSSTLKEVDWNSELVRGDLATFVQQLKQQPGKGIGVGGVKLAMALTEMGWMDEYQIVVHPRIIGRGPTLFAGLSKMVDLKLVGREEFGSGAVAMRYELKRKATL